jgi:hypothetical protein
VKGTEGAVNTGGTLPLPGEVGAIPPLPGAIEGTLSLPGIEAPAPRARRRREVHPMQPVPCLPKELPEEEGELPPYIAVEDITRASKFSDHTVRKHIQKLGLAEKIGGRLWIAREKLRDGWPSLYDRLRELLGRGG